MSHLDLRPEKCFFWSTHQGAELDLLVTVGGRRVGFEIKRTTTPRVTNSMHIAMADLRLDRLYAVYDGEESYALGDRIHAVPVTRLFSDVHL